MKTRIPERFFRVPVYWRWLGLVVTALATGLALARPVLAPVLDELSRTSRKLEFTHEQVDWYLENRQRVEYIRKRTSALSERWQAFTELLNETRKRGAEQLYIDAALETGVTPEHIQVLEHGTDEYGTYAAISVKVKGKHPQTRSFFRQILEQGNPAVWDSIILEKNRSVKSTPGSSLSLESRHYLSPAQKLHKGSKSK